MIFVIPGLDPPMRAEAVSRERPAGCGGRWPGDPL